MTKPFYKVREIRDLRDLIDQSVELFGERYAFEVKKDNGEHYFITYKQYRDDINALGTVLLSMGYSGGRIAIAADNCYEWCMTYMAAINGVGVVVPTDKELMSDDICGILNAAEVSVLFCDEKILEKLDRSGLKKETLFVCFKQKEDDERALSFDRLVSKGRKLLEGGFHDYLNVKIDPEALCTLLFTSGTTGTSKGVMLNQRNFCAEVTAAMGVVRVYPEDCGISMLPLHHTYESTIILFIAPYTGAKVTFCEGFKYVLKNMKEFSPSVFVSVPLVLETVHRRLLKEIRRKPGGEKKFKIGKAICKAGSKVGLDLKKVFFKEIQEAFGGSMRLIICGAAPINPQILEDFDAFGIQIIFGYGMTETAPLTIINNDRLHLSKSVGVPLPGVEAKILNPDPQTGVGEILVKGPMVMMGYYNNPEATAEVIDGEGFLHTGDLGSVDKKGRFYIAGRIKNVIVTENGKNIYPEEIEYHLSTNPIVGDSLVFADTDRKGNTVVKAKIFPNIEEIKEKLKKTELSDTDIEAEVANAVADINKRLPQFKRISGFNIRRKEFIKTTTQKIQRFRDENTRD
ncbi:MAG: AMP-binding protein [Oscillospiraceae bacterium]|nr:AMP-binding protein [Oscillospiraceae bacterium]